MGEKRRFYRETAYAVGLAALALGTALMEAADFGVSMVVAPAYILYLKLSPLYPLVTFGVAEYILQATLLLLMTAVLRRFRLTWLFAFLTTVIYGLLLDGCMLLTGLLPAAGLWARAALYVFGLAFCSLGVSLLFHTYLPPEIYELLVKEIAQRYGFRVHRVKTVYDCVSCLVAIAMSIAFFGRFEGVKWGTVVCALVNGWLIGRLSAYFDARFEFTDRFRHDRLFPGES